jgi:DNA-binding PadR family transcriptional regulator
MGRDAIGSLEELVLLALARVEASGDGDEAYGMTVRRELADRAGREVSIGAVYSTLDRMEAKSWVSSRLADPDPGRGGRPRRYFVLTDAGRAAVGEARSIRERMWEGLDGLLRPSD